MDMFLEENLAEEKRKALIYELMIGLYDLKILQFPESEVVEDEFLEGKPCAELYGRVYDAHLRLCERLGVDEDEDIETIINCMNDITRILAMKMYDYGANSDKLPKTE